MESILKIDGHDVKFRASGATPRIYRKMFGRDIFSDMDGLIQAVSNNNGNLAGSSLEVFENVAYVMAKQADPDIPDADTWFDQFAMFSIYQILPELLNLWSMNEFQTETAKKKEGEQSGN